LLEIADRVAIMYAGRIVDRRHPLSCAQPGIRTRSGCTRFLRYGASGSRFTGIPGRRPISARCRRAAPSIPLAFAFDVPQCVPGRCRERVAPAVQPALYDDADSISPSSTYQTARRLSGASAGTAPTEIRNGIMRHATGRPGCPSNEHEYTTDALVLGRASA
jgi:hypothetical protein